MNQFVPDLSLRGSLKRGLAGAWEPEGSQQLCYEKAEKRPRVERM